MLYLKPCSEHQLALARTRRLQNVGDELLNNLKLLHEFGRKKQERMAAQPAVDLDESTQSLSPRLSLHRMKSSSTEDNLANANTSSSFTPSATEPSAEMMNKDDEDNTGDTTSSDLEDEEEPTNEETPVSPRAKQTRGRGRGRASARELTEEVESEMTLDSPVAVTTSRGRGARGGRGRGAQSLTLRGRSGGRLRGRGLRGGRGRGRPSSLAAAIAASLVSLRARGGQTQVKVRGSGKGRG